MDAVEENLRQLLKGSYIDSETYCDFTLAQQNESTVAKGVEPIAPSHFTPIVSKTVSYIVLGVFINDKNEVLMMQEAKKSCAGQWYLPAGRMEPGENIQIALCREVLEETGLVVQPTTLLLVECAGGSWFRFVFTGKIIGGHLKTPAQADAESLQAKWVDNVNELSLRASDVLEIIAKARLYHKSKAVEPWHEHLLPTLKSHNKLLLRLVILIKKKSSNRIHVLLSEKTKLHFPTCEIYPAKSLHATLRKFLIEIFGADLDMDSHKPHGLLNVEHKGGQEGGSDGLLLTALVSFRIPLENMYPIDKYSWVLLSESMEESLNLRIKKNMTVPLKVLR